MKYLEIIKRHDSAYQAACDFSNQIYLDRLGSPIRRPPDVLVAIVDNGLIQGCIGLDLQVNSSLFVNDLRFLNYTRKIKAEAVIAEQNIFAVDRLPSAIPVLISAITAYAESLSIDMIAFAGIPMSCKTVQRLGYELVILGPTDIELIDHKERWVFKNWIETYQPNSCLLYTNNASAILDATLERFSKKFDPTSFLKTCNNLKEQLRLDNVM